MPAHSFVRADGGPVPTGPGAGELADRARLGERDAVRLVVKKGDGRTPRVVRPTNALTRAVQQRFALLAR